MADQNLGEMCSKAQELALSITTDLLRFLHQLQIAPGTESVRSLEERTVRIQEFRQLIDNLMLTLADLCSRIHCQAPSADAECVRMLADFSKSADLSTVNGSAGASGKVVFDNCMNEQRENTVEYFTLKAELDIVNREIGQLIADFRNVLLIIDTSENTNLNTNDLPLSF